MIAPLPTSLQVLCRLALRAVDPLRHMARRREIETSVDYFGLRVVKMSLRRTGTGAQIVRRLPAIQAEVDDEIAALNHQQANALKHICAALQVVRIRFCRFILALAVATLAVPAGAEMLRGRVIGISDGDTLTMLVNGDRTVRVRLAEIDAPEAGQAHGRAAKSALAAMTFKRTASAKVASYDRYGRAIAIVSIDGLNVNADMVRRGFAWAYVRYQKDAQYSLIEQTARAQSRGLWRDPTPVPPWSYRRARR